MNTRDDRMAATGVRPPNTIPDVPLPESNEPDTLSRWARQVMDSFGLLDWNFGWDNAKRRMGCCHHGTRRITMSRYFVERNGLDEIRDTLLHEIAHALVGPRHGHDTTWKAMARRIGARPVRCGNADMPEGRWRAECPACCCKFSRHKQPRRLTGWHCKDCGRRRGVLIWRLEEA